MTFRIETTREGKGWMRWARTHSLLKDAQRDRASLNRGGIPLHNVRVVCDECGYPIPRDVDAHGCAVPGKAKRDADLRAPTPEEMAVLERFETAFLTGPKEAVNWFDEKVAAYEKDGWTEPWRRPDPEYSATGGTRVFMVRRTEASMMKRAAEALPDYSDRWTAEDQQRWDDMVLKVDPQSDVATISKTETVRGES